MKTSRSTSSRPAKDSKMRQATGGQPESDQDAREAGVRSATSTQSGKKSKRPTSARGGRGRN